MTIGSMGYVINDAFVRRVTEEGPGVYQVLCIRGIGLALVFLIAGRLRSRPFRRSDLQRPLLLRVAAETVASALFFAGVIRLEFANVQAILQVVPFAVMLAAVVVLGEQVRGRQYVAILLGFVGVLIVVRPATDGFSAWSLVVLASAMFQVARELATRDVDTDTPGESIAFVTAIGLSVFAAGLSLFSGWQMPTAVGAVYLALSVASLAVGYYFTIQTVRIGDLSISAPFRYTVLVGAVVIGYLLFGEIPDRFTVIGSVIIVVTGLYAVQLERTVRSDTDAERDTLNAGRRPRPE